MYFSFEGFLVRSSTFLEIWSTKLLLIRILSCVSFKGDHKWLDNLRTKSTKDKKVCCSYVCFVTWMNVEYKTGYVIIIIWRLQIYFIVKSCKREFQIWSIQWVTKRHKTTIGRKCLFFNICKVSLVP